VTNLKKVYRSLIGVFLMIALLGTMSSTASAMGPGPGTPGTPPDHARMEDGSYWITTDIIAIMANGEIPQLHFWYKTDDGTRAKFSTSFVMLVEFEDQNDDDAYQTGEELYFAPLAAYEWTVTTGSIEEDGVTTEVWLKYTKSGVSAHPLYDMAPAALGRPGNVDRFADVTIQIWAHIYLEDYMGEVRDDSGVHANYTVPGRSEMKMDIEIGNFPFSSEDSSIALETLLKENEATGPNVRHRVETRERFRNVSIDSSMNWTTEGGNESRFESMNGTHTQCVEFVDSESGAAQGYFSWVDKAVITWPGGVTEAVDVTVSYAPVGVGVAVYLAYPYFDDGSILHDPSIGLYEANAPLVSTPVDLVLIAGIGGVALIALLVVIVRKK
jgi:hypothetical protein